MVSVGAVDIGVTTNRFVCAACSHSHEVNYSSVVTAPLHDAVITPLVSSVEVEVQT